jgi:hypothetical protein
MNKHPHEYLPFRSYMSVSNVVLQQQLNRRAAGPTDSPGHACNCCLAHKAIKSLITVAAHQDISDTRFSPDCSLTVHHLVLRCRHFNYSKRAVNRTEIWFEECGAGSVKRTSTSEKSNAISCLTMDPYSDHCLAEYYQRGTLHMPQHVKLKHICSP